MIGYINEIEFINILNEKKYKDINIVLQDLIKALYPDVKDDTIIKASKYGYYAKADIIIEINGIKKGISIKSGIKNSVHLEPIEKFITFLTQNGFAETDKFLEYIYSDGTRNNTGKIRQSASEYKENHSDDIAIINKNLEKIKYKLLIRALIKTDINYKVTVDAFIVGTINDFFWATKEEVLDFLIEENKESASVHVSNLFIQCWNKNIKCNTKYEYCRNYIQIKWYSIFDDLIKIMQKRI